MRNVQNFLEGHGLDMTNSAMSAPRMTVPRFMGMKTEGKKISMLTAYDYPMAKLLDESGIDAILVGDTMSMVVQGHNTTLPVTLDEIIYHAEMVQRAVRRSLVIVDMPFPSNHLGVHTAIEHAARILKETGCQAVKLESGAEHSDVILGLVSAGIPVMAHVGLRPQCIHQLGGYKLQRDAERMLNDAKAAEDAGAFSVVLECIPAEIAAEVTQSIRIPTIGIGAGADCDGQVLVLHDLLGLTPGRVPSFVRQYANVAEIVKQAARDFGNDVRHGQFPSEPHTFH